MSHPMRAYGQVIIARSLSRSAYQKRKPRDDRGFELMAIQGSGSHYVNREYLRGAIRCYQEAEIIDRRLACFGLPRAQVHEALGEYTRALELLKQLAYSPVARDAKTSIARIIRKLARSELEGAHTLAEIQSFSSSPCFLRWLAVMDAMSPGRRTPKSSV